MEQVEALADGGSDVNQPGHSDVTSLHVAAMCGHLEVSQAFRYQLSQVPLQTDLSVYLSVP